MTDVAPTTEQEPVQPDAGCKVVYLGPTHPHWDFRHDFGERSLIDDFRTRADARLVLLPPHDPQFRRNRERVNRDAERHNIRLEWDLGYEEEEPTPRPPRQG